MRTLLIALSVTIGTFLLQSCCEQEYIITGPEELIVFLDNHKQVEKTDTVKTPFDIQVYYKRELIGLIPSYSIIPSAYALTCEKEFKNCVLNSSIKLHCNRPFVYKNDSIFPSDNIVALEGFQLTHYNEFVSHRFHFNQDFLSNANFETGSHTFILNSSTSDQVEIIDSIQVILDLP